MKMLFALTSILFLATLSFAQTCQIPSLRGLKLGMTPAEVDSLFVVEDDKIIFDDVVYSVVFTRNKLIRIYADYSVKSDIGEFIREFSTKTNLPSDWNKGVLKCPTFSATAFIYDDKPRVILRLTNNSKNKDFQP